MSESSGRAERTAGDAAARRGAAHSAGSVSYPSGDAWRPAGSGSGPTAGGENHAAPRRKHSKAFKQGAVELSRRPGMSVAQAARDLGICENMLHRWRHELADHQERAFPGNGRRRDLEDEVVRLRRENEQLRMEREILKKATAFFANQLPGGLLS